MIALHSWSRCVSLALLHLCFYYGHQTEVSPTLSLAIHSLSWTCHKFLPSVFLFLGAWIFLVRMARKQSSYHFLGQPVSRRQLSQRNIPFSQVVHLSPLYPIRQPFPTPLPSQLRARLLARLRQRPTPNQRLHSSRSSRRSSHSRLLKLSLPAPKDPTRSSAKTVGEASRARSG